MSLSRVRLATVLVAGVSLVTLPVAVTAPAGASSRPATVSVFITKGHAVRMAHHLRPGVHRFVVRSAGESSFQIVRTRPGYSQAELAHDVAVGVNGGDMTAFRRFERNVTLLGGIATRHGERGVMYVDLPRGKRYLAVDTNAAPRFHHFTVGGHRLAGRLPSARTISAVGATRWGAQPRVIARSGTLRFANRSSENHFIALARLQPGKTLADWNAFIAKAKAGDESAVPPVSETGEIDTGVVSPGHVFAFRYHLPAGHYVLTCWWGDADMGGMPHAFMGMNRELVVR
jgi:hypothetical protein